MFYSVVKESCLINEGALPTDLSLLTRSHQKHPPQCSGPFAIYSVEVHTQFSKTCLKKNFADFARLQKLLLQLGGQLEQRNGLTGKLSRKVSLRSELPTLPMRSRSLLSSWLSSST